MAAGFTLVETVVVMAIIGLLFVIVFIGQGEVQARARFNAAVDQSVENINYARSQGASNINPTGNGNDPHTVQAGVDFEIKNAHLASGYPLEEITPVFALIGSDGQPDYSNLTEVPYAGIDACNPSDHPSDNDECWEQYLHLGDSLVVANPDSSGTPYDEVVLAFIHKSTGLTVCHVAGPGFTSFTDACDNAGTPLEFNLVDQTDSNLKATIQVDPETGLARRLN
jgi:prepilin-type N-terminal cleavage/methylation domain-containing protein